MHIRLKTKLETKARHREMKCRVFDLKVQKNHLSKDNKEHLHRLFREAKWFYNHCVEFLNQGKLDDVDTKTRIVPVKTPDGIDYRGLTALSSQMKQGIHERLWSNLKSLSSQKKGGSKVGRIWFKPRIDSIPLKQFEVTYDLDRQGKRVRLQGLPKWLRVNGFDQIPLDSEIANAHLTRGRGSYYLKVTTYCQPEDKAKEGIIGIDAGCGTQLTLSNGVKVGFGSLVPRNVRKADHVLARKRGERKGYWSGKYGKAKDKRIKAYGRWVNQKKDARNKVVNVLSRTFGTICMQDENVKGWQASGHGKAVSRTNIGGTMLALQRKATTPLLVGRFFPSTKTCSACGFKKDEMRVWERVYDCPGCKAKLDRDVNAAINILVEGMRKLPAERRKTMPLEGGASSAGLMGSLNTIPTIQAKLCPLNGEANEFIRW